MKSIGALSHQYRANYRFHHCKTILTYQDMFWRVHNRCGVFDRDCNKDLYNTGHILSSTQNTSSIPPEISRTFSTQMFHEIFLILCPVHILVQNNFRLVPKSFGKDQCILNIGQKAKFDKILHYNPTFIANLSWIITINRSRIFMNFQKINRFQKIGLTNTNCGYNGASKLNSNITWTCQKYFCSGPKSILDP